MVKEEKLKAVERLAKKIDDTNVIGVIDMHKLPSKQFQEIHKKIRNSIEFVNVKKSILMRAIEKSGKKNIKKLVEDMPKQPSLIFTDMDPFKFYMTASKLKSPNYAKEGDIADEDIEVGAGPTDLMPGPVISEFSKVGIPAGVENGKIAIKKSKIVAKKGDMISKDLANILRKLKIQPVKVGMKIVTVYDKGTVYPNEVLAMAGQGYIDQTVLAHQHAINLTVSIGYPTRENIGMILAKAQREAQAIESKLRVSEPAPAKEMPEAGDDRQTETPKSEESQTQDSQSGGTI